MRGVIRMHCAVRKRSEKSISATATNNSNSSSRQHESNHTHTHTHTHMHAHICMECKMQRCRATCLRPCVGIHMLTGVRYSSTTETCIPANTDSTISNAISIAIAAPIPREGQSNDSGSTANKLSTTIVPLSISIRNDKLHRSLYDVRLHR